MDCLHIKNIKNSLDGLCAKHAPYTVFRDWVEMMALSTDASCKLFHSEDIARRESLYAQTISKYSKEEVDVFAKMSADLVLAFDEFPFDDYLGALYMEMFGENKLIKKKFGQVFTPTGLCRVCAQTTCEAFEDKTLTISDECCGGGAMLIAACEAYHKKNVDYQKRILFKCGDIDLLCVYMCYVQLSLIGARAIVYHQNTITHEVFDRFVTPMELMRGGL